MPPTPTRTFHRPKIAFTIATSSAILPDRTGFEYSSVGAGATSSNQRLEVAVWAWWSTPSTDYDSCPKQGSPDGAVRYVEPLGNPVHGLPRSIKIDHRSLPHRASKAFLAFLRPPKTRRTGGVTVRPIARPEIDYYALTEVLLDAVEKLSPKERAKLAKQGEMIQRDLGDRRRVA